MSSTRKKNQQKKLDRKYRKEIRSKDSYKASVTINVLVDHYCDTCFFYKKSFSGSTWSWSSEDSMELNTYQGFDHRGNPVEKKKRVRNKPTSGCNNQTRNTRELPAIQTCGFWKEKEEGSWEF